jgi:hypothetical protein
MARLSHSCEVCRELTASRVVIGCSWLCGFENSVTLFAATWTAVGCVSTCMVCVWSPGCKARLCLLHCHCMCLQLGAAGSLNPTSSVVCVCVSTCGCLVAVCVCVCVCVCTAGLLCRSTPAAHAACLVAQHRSFSCIAFAFCLIHVQPNLECFMHNQSTFLLCVCACCWARLQCTAATAVGADVGQCMSVYVVC